jgi:hypothetical protein
LANEQEYRNAIAAVNAGTANSHQIQLAEKMAQQSSFLGANPLTGEAKRALESLGKKKQ